MSKLSRLFLILIIISISCSILYSSSESTSATLYMRQEIWDKAVVFWEKHLKNKPNDADAHMQAGICYGRLDDYQKAYDHFAAAMKLKPELIKDIDAFRIDFLRNRSSNEGVSSYKKAEESKDKAEQTKLYEEAINHFKKALIIAPEWSEGYIMIGQIYSKMDQKEKALELYDQAYQKNKDNLIVLSNIASIYRQNKKIDKAKEIYSILIEATKPENIEKNPNKQVKENAKKIRTDAMTGYAALLMAENKQSEAMKIYEQLIADNPSSSTLYYNIGLAYYETEQWENAATSFLKSAEFEKEKKYKGDAFWKAGMSYIKAKDWQKSIDAWLEYLKLFPEDANAHQNLAVCYLNTGNNMKYTEHKQLAEKYQKQN